MVERLDVDFNSEGLTCRAWLYRGDGPGPRPTVVLVGGRCYVREVVMPTYAAAFAAAGLNALVFDYRNLGVSDGDNRQHLDPWAEIRDYQNAISFLERQRRWTLTVLGLGRFPIWAGTPWCLRRLIHEFVRSSVRYRSLTDSKTCAAPMARWSFAAYGP